MPQKKFPMVRGRRMRVTAVDECGLPVTGASSTVVTEGFISVAMTGNYNEGEDINVQNAGGKTCVTDEGETEFLNYGLEIVMCDVDPELYALFTGNALVADSAGDNVGFRVNSDTIPSATAFALELWTGVPSDSCSGGATPYGYLLLPFIKGGVLGDFTVENAAINMTISQASTKDGNQWGQGAYDVVKDTGDVDSVLLTALDPNDHLHVQYTTVPPPAATDGAVAYPPV